jgi:hypothetical protein
MAVIEVNITHREPYANAQPFGTTGAYERIDGVLTYAVDPTHTANQAIVDLALAPRDAQGSVQFRSDFTLLVPQIPAQGNRRLLVDIVNRGRKRAVGTFNRAPATQPESWDIPPGDGFLFRHGYAVVSIGWQWDVYRSDALLGLEAPQAHQQGQPVRGQVQVDMRPNVRETTRLLADRVHRPYPVADLDEAEAVLMVRAWSGGPATVIPREQWRFARETNGAVVASREHVYLASGFKPGKLYSIVYTTDAAPVVGTGLLAVRDVAVWLRHASDLNPVPGGFERVYGYGVSQTGRLLRHFLYVGLNQDEAGRLVYDGLLPHIAGGRRGEFNHRFAQPSQQHTPSFGHLFPFADEALTDAYTQRTDGLLTRLRTLQAVPKILYTNSSAEYWRGDAPLIHIDPATHRDLEPSADSRVYHFAGTQHVTSGLPQASGPGPDGSVGRYPYNVLDYRPLLRAALINLDQWVSQGIEPPPSRHPRLDDGTATTRREVIAAFETIADLFLPDPERLWFVREVDLGPEAAHGVGRFPAQEGRPYACYVSAVDSDGNEVGGIRLPDLEVPVGTHTGWNPRAPETGAPEQIMPMQGFTAFFAPTKAVRQACNDQRPSLEERYANRDAYLAQVRAVADRLAAARYVLEEDIELLVSACAACYDAAVKAPGLPRQAHQVTGSASTTA